MNGQTIDRFAVNTVFEMPSEEGLFRILWRDTESDVCYWISLGKKGRTPTRGTIQELKDKGSIPAEDPETYTILDDEISENNRIRREKFWDALGPIVVCEPDIYEPRRRAELLRDAEKRSGIRMNNLYEYLGRYWKKGKTANAFLSDYSKVGTTRDYRKGGYKKQGRPKKEGAFGKALEEKDYMNFETVIRRYYNRKEKLTLQETYDRMLIDFYSERTEEGSHKLLGADRIPSYKQFCYWHSKHRDAAVESVQREGEKEFNLKGRAVLGRTEERVMGPGMFYQIDATIADVYLVARYNRTQVVGRPTLYFIIDAYSRMVVGMNISLEAPSWVAAMMAIENAVSNKTEYCARYGIDIGPEDWPCHHIPNAIIADRGEMESRYADCLTSKLGIRIENMPAYRADLKGIIEQRFRTIDLQLSDLTPGKVKKDFGERTVYDYRLDALLDIEQFTRIIIECVLFYNNSHYLESYKQNEEQLRCGVMPIARNIWNWGIRSCSGALRVIPREQVRLALLPTAHARITEKGIRFKKMYYICEEAVREHWFETARRDGNKEITVSYDPRDMSSIYCWAEDADKPYLCRQVDYERRSYCSTLAEIESEQTQSARNKALHESAEMQAKTDLIRNCDSVIEEARKQRSSVEPGSARSVIQGINDARRREKEALRTEEAFTSEDCEITDKEKASLSTDQNGGGKPSLSPQMRMLIKNRDERRNKAAEVENGNDHSV